MEIYCSVNGLPVTVDGNGFVNANVNNLGKGRIGSLRTSAARALYREFAKTVAAKDIDPNCAKLTDVSVVFRSRRFEYAGNGKWSNGSDDLSCDEYIDSMIPLIRSHAKRLGRKYLGL